MELDYRKPKIILGLMRLNPLTWEDLHAVITYALDHGIYYFDISDIYGRHSAEEKLGEVLKHDPSLRKRMFIQTKCGIVKQENQPTYMDLSYEHIKQSCYDSLKRMNLDYLDSFLLHRVDIFMDAKEIAKAFQELKEEGKVHHFGVSNMDKEQIEYLKTEVKEEIFVDQLQLGLGQPSLISQCFNVNSITQVPNLQDGLFYYLKRKNILLQAWSPLIYGLFEGSIFSVPEMENTRKCLDKLARKYHSTSTGIAISFVTSLGDNVSALIGSMNPKHIQEAIDGSKITLSRQDWYELYQSTGNKLP